MRAFVSGDCGFVGSHVSAELRARGHEVYGMDVKRGRHEDVLGYFSTTADDDIDLIVHCAATAPHRAAIDGQPMNLATDLELDAAMFRWAVRTGTRVLYLSSSAAYPVVYQSREWVESHGPMRLAERLVDLDEPLIPQPDAAYGWTKLTGEKMARAVAEHVPVHVVRPFSGYGEAQGENWPFGAFVARAKRREDPFVIWGDGTQTRDWVHVSDLVAGMLAVVDNDVREPVNICTGVGMSMLDLVRMVTAAAGYEPEIELRIDKPTGVAWRVGDPSTMERWYTPKISLAEGVERAMR